MSRIPVNRGGSFAARSLGEAGFSGVVFRALAGDEDLSVTNLGARLGWPEESVRNYRDGNSSPAFDRLVTAFRRPTAPAPLVLDALQTLGGQRAIVCLVDNLDVPAATRPADVVKQVIQALSGFDAMLQDAYERAADGVICADDAAAIAKRWAEVRGLGERAVRFAQHCAAGGRR